MPHPLTRKPPLKPLHRVSALSALSVCLCLLAACGTPGPAPQLYQLQAEPPAPVTEAQPPVALQLQLMAATLPELLERDALLVPQGGNALQVLPGHRWAEPLRDAVPRLLRQDLALWLGLPQVWAAPVPAGVVVQRQLRVEVLQLQVDAARSRVQLQARWTLSDPAGSVPPQGRVETLSAPVVGTGVDAIVSAHRMVLWRLAGAVAAGVRARSAP
jgi:uncharacterized lipoprotein YmbA